MAKFKAWGSLVYPSHSSHAHCLIMLFLFLSFRMLDDFGHELEMTDSKLQQTVLKVEKVLRLSDGKQFVPI